MSHFKYPATCPQIDDAIMAAKAALHTCMDDFLRETHPSLSPSVRYEVVERWRHRMYSAIERAFEVTRRTNANMRGAAEAQISQSHGFQALHQFMSSGRSRGTT